MNKVALEGRLGKDPEIRYLPDGKMVVNATLATSNDYKNKQTEEWVKRPADWHNLVAFGAVGEQLAGYKKGEKIAIEGKITYKDWTDKAGAKRKSTEIQIWQITAKQQPAEPTPDEEMPF